MVTSYLLHQCSQWYLNTFIYPPNLSKLAIQQTQISPRRGWYSIFFCLTHELNKQTTAPESISNKSIFDSPQDTAAKTYFFFFSDIIS